MGSTTSVTLGDIVALLAKNNQLVAAPALGSDATTTTATTVTGLSSDSRVVRAGHVFACKGTAFRSAYLAAAARAGAVAYLTSAESAPQLARVAPCIPAIVVRDVRVAMAAAAPLAWHNPAANLRVCGVTGTKGKSTATYMLRAILDTAAGHDGATALIGSIETYDGVTSTASVNTTPEAPDLWRHLAAAGSAGVHDVVMEVSSQALKYHRVDGLTFDVAALLNLGRDHISPIEHPTLDDYIASKLRIFAQARVGVVNACANRADTALAAARASCERVVSFAATPDAGADVYAMGARAATAGELRAARGSDSHAKGADGSAASVGTTFAVHTPDWDVNLTIPLPGAFNVENALAAVAMARELGVEPGAVSAGLARTRVPGRMEVIATAADNGVVGVVDFAHNAMALSRFFPAVRDTWPGATIIAVFGATGDKGIERRHEMPAEAAKWADRLIFTEDDAGEESVERICAAMVAAVGGRVPCEVVPDRAEAVERAVELAFAVDGPAVVCLLGRGTEPTMHRGDSLVRFPLDAELLNAALRRPRS